MIRPDGTVSDDITTTIKPAERIPSVGVQLTIEAPCCDRFGPEGIHAPACRRYFDAQRAHAPATTPRPERLTLWDQPADLWSTDR